MDIQIPTTLPFSQHPIKKGPRPDEINAACQTINSAILRLHQLLYAGFLNSPTYPAWIAGIASVPGQVGISNLLEAIGPDEHGKEFSIKGKTPEEVYRLVYLFEEAKRSGRVRPEGACCLLAEPRNCVCTQSFACPVHGTQCQGSHE